MRSPLIRVGSAGWALPRAERHRFPVQGTSLARYAEVFSCVEINSSFSREHKAETYARWAKSVPASFRFAVKLPKIITHERRLEGVKEQLTPFLEAVGALGRKLGILLVQLPPSFEFELRTAKSFFKLLRRQHSGAVVLEPRHVTWFNASALALAEANGISRVVADPAPKGCADCMLPGADIAYFRLHGSPRMYFSPYTDEYLAGLAVRFNEIAARKTPVWCIFDNTGSGAATANAFMLQDKLSTRKAVVRRNAAKK
jgi:uncharacterized protein YecE (DUF72 family)